MCIFYVDLLYPNQVSSRYRYDFYFPDFNEYVEIAGMDDEEYLKKIKIKKELFNPIILYTVNDIKKYVNDLAIRYKQLEETLCQN